MLYPGHGGNARLRRSEASSHSLSSQRKWRCKCSKCSSEHALDVITLCLATLVGTCVSILLVHAFFS